MQDEENYDNLVWFQDAVKNAKVAAAPYIDPSAQKDFGAYTVDFTVSGESRALEVEETEEQTLLQPSSTSESWNWDLLAPPPVVPDAESPSTFSRVQQIRNQMQSVRGY